MHLVVHIVHQLASDIAKVSEAIALTQPASPPVHMFVCALNCVCASLGHRRPYWPSAPRLCLKASSPKVIIRKSAIELLSQISACWRAKMLRDREDEPKRRRINVGYKNISHPQPLALTCHIFITRSTSFSYSQHLKEGIYLHYFKHGKSQSVYPH